MQKTRKYYGVVEVQAKLMNWFWEKFKKYILDPKIPHFVELELKNIFFKKSGFSIFLNYDPPPSCEKSGKTNELLLRKYIK